MSDSDRHSDTGSTITVEVAYGNAERQVLLELELPRGTTVRQAAEKAAAEAALDRLFADFRLDPERLGIFGSVVDPDRELRGGDRVEIYRPLPADPKELRRRRASRS